MIYPRKKSSTFNDAMAHSAIVDEVPVDDHFSIQSFWFAPRWISHVVAHFTREHLLSPAFFWIYTAIWHKTYAI